MKRKQARNGIKEGYKKIIKFLEALLSDPVALVALTNWKKGTCLATAILPFFEEQGG